MPYPFYCPLLNMLLPLPPKKHCPCLTFPANRAGGYSCVREQMSTGAAASYTAADRLACVAGTLHYSICKGVQAAGHHTIERQIYLWRRREINYAPVLGGPQEAVAQSVLLPVTGGLHSHISMCTRGATRKGKQTNSRRCCLMPQQ